MAANGYSIADPNDALVTRPIDAWEGSATAGGPLLKDRIWFYAGYDKSKSKTDTPLWIPLATWNQTLYDAKITGDFASNHRAWLAFHNEKALSGNQTWGQTWDPTMGYDQHINNNTLQAQYQWVVAFADAHASETFTIFRRDVQCLITLRYGGTGQHERFKNVAT